MTEKKPAPKLKEAAATQRMSKGELAELLKQAEEEDAKKKGDADGDAADDAEDEGH